MNKIFINLLIVLISLFSFCSEVYAAEILQVTSSSVLLIGDHNRTYTVKLACTEISPDLGADFWPDFFPYATQAPSLVARKDLFLS